MHSLMVSLRLQGSWDQPVILLRLSLLILNYYSVNLYFLSRKTTISLMETIFVQISKISRRNRRIWGGGVRFRPAGTRTQIWGKGNGGQFRSASVAFPQKVRGACVGDASRSEGFEANRPKGGSWAESTVGSLPHTQRSVSERITPPPPKEKAPFRVLFLLAMVVSLDRIECGLIPEFYRGNQHSYRRSNL